MQRYALLIGNSIFGKESGFSPLRFPPDDVRDLAKALEPQERGGFKTTCVIEETKSYVERELSALIRVLTPDDIILMYYSGHGKPDEDGELCLACSDSIHTDLLATTLSLSYIYKCIQRFRAKRIALILDCCFSGLAGQRFTRGKTAEQIDNSIQSGLRGSGVYVLTASTDVQLAEEKEVDGHGLLTKHILDGIETGSADEDDDGFISMDELSRYVQESLKGTLQTPQRYVWRAEAGGMLIVSTGHRPFSKKRREVENAILSARLHHHIPEDVRDCALAAISHCALDKQGVKAFKSSIDDLHRKTDDPDQFIGALWLLYQESRLVPAMIATPGSNKVAEPSSDSEFSENSAFSENANSTGKPTSQSNRKATLSQLQPPILIQSWRVRAGQFLNDRKIRRNVLTSALLIIFLLSTFAYLLLYMKTRNDLAKAEKARRDAALSASQGTRQHPVSPGKIDTRNAPLIVNSSKAGKEAAQESVGNSLSPAMPFLPSDAEGVRVKASFKATGKTWAGTSWPLYTVHLGLNASDSVLEKTRKVQYVSKEWNPPRKIGTKRNRGFAMTYLGYQCVNPVTITLLPRNRSSRSLTLPNFNLCPVWPKN